MIKRGPSLTFLENELLNKVTFLKTLLYEPHYFPKRVEPYGKSDLEESSNWSKFSGETLFVNKNFLKDKHLREAIFWRESLFFFAPKKIRNVWWLQLLANTFPLAVKMSSKAEDAWKQLIAKQMKKYLPLFRLLKLIIASSGLSGFLKVFNKVLYFDCAKIYTQGKSQPRKGKARALKPDEFKIILTEIYIGTVKITEGAISLMQKSLLRQTIKPKILAQYSTKHLTTISKTINHLLDMRILRHNYYVNLSALGLTQYVVLLSTRRNGSNFFNKLLKTPFLVSQKKNCLANCFITQLFTAPKTSKFFHYLSNYCEDLMEKGAIYNYYLFELVDSKRYYTFKYFDPKTKKHQLNFNMLIIESGLFQSEVSRDILKSPPLSETIVIPSKVFKSKLKTINLLELQIINQFLRGIDTYRGIQKAVNKDMNKVVECIKRLHQEQLIFENVVAILPSSNSEVVIYFEKEPPIKKRENYRTVDDRLKYFLTLLPNTYLGEIKGSFQGYLVQSFLQHSTVLELADFLTFFYPEELQFQLVLGKSLFQKYDLTLPLNRWLNGEWLFSEEDFKF